MLAPHGVVRSIGGGFYNHDVHEVLRYVFGGGGDGGKREGPPDRRWESIERHGSHIVHVGLSK